MGTHRRVLVLISLLGILSLTGCGKDALQDSILIAQAENRDIHLSVDGSIETKYNSNSTWTELDQLTSFKDLRRNWDKTLNIVNFDISSKNGIMFVGLDGNWLGNNTLYNVLQNKAFYEYWTDGAVRSALAQSAISEFSDIDGENNGIKASVNAYFNLVPTNQDGTSGLFNTLNRAEAMALIVKGDTSVFYQDDISEFENIVGVNPYNSIAIHATGSSYLDYKNGSLCADTYNSPITQAEFIYMLVQRHFKEEYDSLGSVKGAAFTNCVNAGDIATKLGIKDGHAWQAYELEYCLQAYENKCPESLYKALVVARNHGIISNDINWRGKIAAGTAVTYMINTYEQVYKTNGFAVNAKTGHSEGQNLAVKQEEIIQTPESSEVEIGGAEVTQIRDVTNLDDLFKIYGEEIDMTDEEKAEAYEVASKWTFKPADCWLEVANCSYLNVRKGPSTDYDILRSIPAGSKCHVVAVCEENGWYRIIADNKVVYQCGAYFQDFEGSENYQMKTGENANDY